MLTQSASYLLNEPAVMPAGERENHPRQDRYVQSLICKLRGQDACDFTSTERIENAVPLYCWQIAFQDRHVLVEHLRLDVLQVLDFTGQNQRRVTPVNFLVHGRSDGEVAILVVDECFDQVTPVPGATVAIMKFMSLQRHDVDRHLGFKRMPVDDRPDYKSRIGVVAVSPGFRRSETKTVLGWHVVEKV